VICLLYITSSAALQWDDCGLPLTRKLYFQSVVESPSTINIASQESDNSVNINVGVNIQNYVLDYGVSYYIEVVKDDKLYVNTTVGDLCDTLSVANQVACPLSSGSYSFSYLYNLPPLPTGNYTITIVSYEDFPGGNQIGCLEASMTIIGLGLAACTYTSSLAATFIGTAYYSEDDTVIQIGPWGLGGKDLGYPWGTFKSVVATADLVGYAFQPNNYVWGITGALNASGVANQFDGTVVIGYRPDVSNNEGATLVYQGFFSWVMTPAQTTPFIFNYGTFVLAPTYFYPVGFPYPLNFGNLGPTFTITQDPTSTYFSIQASLDWCRCNCAFGGIGHDDILDKPASNSMSGWMKGTIAICVIGGLVIIAAVFFIIRTRRHKPRPVVYDDADLMEPQKPDYGSMAMGEAFADEDQEFN